MAGETVLVGCKAPNGLILNLDRYEVDAQGRARRMTGLKTVTLAGWAHRIGFEPDPTAETGGYRFETIKPGRVPAPDGNLQAPHVSLWIVARGINLGLNTRMYFSDEEEANAADPVLRRIEHRGRIPTLIGTRQGNVYRFDIHLQGAQETVFFDI